MQYALDSGSWFKSSVLCGLNQVGGHFFSAEEIVRKFKQYFLIY